MDNRAAVTVGILADTHGTLTHQAFAALADSDYIIHAGDIGDPSIIHELEALAPVFAVLGNNDFAEYGVSVQRFAYPEIAGIRFLVAHLPRDARIGWNGGPGVAAGDPVPHVVIHGHTHVPCITTGKDARPATMLICPGSASYPRGGSKPSIAKLVIAEGKIVSATCEGV